MENTKELELQVVKKQSSGALEAAQSINITSQQKFEEANVIKDKIVAARKFIVAEKEKRTKPLNETLKWIRASFAPLEDMIDEAERIAKSKIGAYLQEQERKAREAQEKIAEQVKSKDVDLDKGLEKIERVEEKLAAKTNVVRTRINKVVNVVNENDIPDEYWELNMVRVRADALSGKLTKGVEIVEEKIIL